jgi:hypothetical protein
VPIFDVVHGLWLPLLHEVQGLGRRRQWHNLLKEWENAALLKKIFGELNDEKERKKANEKSKHSIQKKEQQQENEF